MEDEIDLREYFAVMGRRKWTIIGVFLVAVIVAAVLSFFVLPPVYEASLLLQPARSAILGSAILVVAEGTGNRGNRRMEGGVYDDPNALASIVESEGFINRAMSKVGVNHEAGSFSVKATVVRNTQLLRLSVRAGDPAQAKRIADSIGQLIVEESMPSIEARRRILQRQLVEVSGLLETARRTAIEARSVVESRLGRSNASPDELLIRSYALSALGSAGETYSALLTAQKDLTLQINDLQPVKIIVGSGSPVLVAPRKAMNVALAAVLGLMAGVMLAFFQEFLSAPRPEAAPAPAPGTHDS